ncbi:sulfatase-like hydrolase/transferase [Roseibacillus persicicus]|uniref:N-acetylgalactosamine-6-sulfatase n=2 Tax=Roseibacillus persicicus TaxID=454148 RepID=A0A918TUI0_9BACT|nr:sulfatase-like hydrolase/transferase [Roseibacillus persicicus]GHC61927.1 N-acetylgalactosamine-6-sulfatase [Roseibacillus persicicus]
MMNMKKLFTFGLLAAFSFAQAEERPNIVVFLGDDMGWGDSGTYGNDLIQTPNMDKLASQGVKLMQCYSACGVCSPSRSAILTGRTPYRNGVWRHLSGNGPAHLREEEITYPELLKEAGYATCHVGKWHLLSKQQFGSEDFPHPDAHGFEHWMATHNNAAPSHKNPNNFVLNGEPLGETEGYSAQLVAAEAGRWLKEIRDKDKPFVMSVWLHEPHSPIATDTRFQKLYEGHENAKYMGNITQLDHALGMVMDALDEEGVADETFFYFSSDNGPVPSYGGSSGGLRGNKRSDYEGGVRVPGIVRWPGRVKAGTTSEVPVIGTDVFTTVLELAGVPLPSDRTIDGANMMPALVGKPVERKVPLFWRTHVSGPKERVAMRIGDWKIVGDETLTHFQLYNIPGDGREKNDLAEEMPEKTAEMKKELIALWNQIKADGPNEWWESERQKPKGNGQLSY